MEDNLIEHSNLLELYEKEKTVPAEQMAVLQSLLRADGAPDYRCSESRDEASKYLPT